MKLTCSQDHFLRNVKSGFNRTGPTNPTALALEKKGIVEQDGWVGSSVLWRLTERGRELVGS